MTDTINEENRELQMLILNKESGFKYRERRHQDWLENYTLYRDKVTINRLTQRQSVNIPLMKQSVRSLLKDVDDMPVLFFENLDNDKEAQVFQNEYWKWTVEQNNLSVVDIVDKKQVFLFGRSFMQMQIEDGRVVMTVQDPQDILVDRFADPTNLDSARYLIHTHIFVPLSNLESNEDYDQAEVAKLKDFFESENGIVKASSNEQMQVDKNKKMSEMGVDDVEDPVLGETLVELTLSFVRRAEGLADGEEQFFMYVEAENQVILLKKPLEDVIGKTKDNYWRDHLPYNTWADDVERQDFWSDGIADVIRTPNKVINSWFSQLVENRTLRNFGMHYYDGTKGDGEFAPQTFNPQPWGWYKVPGNPSEVMKKVDIPDLSESLDEMQFVIGIAEQATGATKTQQGNITERNITLGEVQLALGEAKERIKGMSKFYTPAWKERGEKFLKLIEAGSDKLDAVKIYKKGRNTDAIFSREIKPTNWMTEAGYRTKVWSQDEKDAQDSEALQKLNASVVNMPGNIKLLEIYQRKLLEFTGALTPDEINDVIEAEKNKPQIDPLTGQPLQQLGAPAGAVGAPVATPAIAPPVAPPAPAPKKKPKKKAKKKKGKNKKIVKKLKSVRKKLANG